MSHLISLYARDLQCQIGQPIVSSHYFPIPCERYITIHNDKKVPAKEYGYFDIVIRLLKPILEEHGIKIVQVGAFGEPTISGVDYHLPTSSIKQLCHILKNSSGHVGIDSLPVHISSMYDKPIVALYAHTYAKTCNPIWNKTTLAYLLESHRNGNKPSFCLSENEQNIDLIMPDDVAKCVLKVLGIQKEINEQVIFIGKRFKNPITDIIPSGMPANLVSQDVFYNIRMDVSHNEAVLNEVLKFVPCEITTSKPFSAQILRHKDKIRSINYITDNFDENFVREVKNFGINIILLCNDKETLSDERFKLFDFMISDLDLEGQIQANAKKLKIERRPFRVKSSRKIIEQDKLHNNFCEYLKSKGASVKEQEDAFLLDVDWFMIYINSDDAKT